MSSIVGLWRRVAAGVFAAMLVGCGGGSSNNTVGTGVNPAPAPQPNRVPSFPANLNDYSVLENENFTSVLPANDPDGDPLIYSISGTDATLFNIDASTATLSSSAAFDFESPVDADEDNVLSVIVTASDGELQATTEVKLSILDVEGIWPATTSVSVAENEVFLFRDPSVGDTDIESIKLGTSGDSSFFELVDGALQSRAAFDFENPQDLDADNTYEVRIDFTEGGEPGSTDLDVIVNDIGSATNLSFVGDDQTELFVSDVAALLMSLEGEDLEDSVSVEIQEGPSWVRLEEGLLIADLRNASPEPGLYTATVVARGSVEGEVTTSGIFEVLEATPILKGRLDENTRVVESAWQDVSVTAVQPLSQAYDVSFIGGRSEAGKPFFKLVTAPKLEDVDEDRLQLQRASLESLDHNYLAAVSGAPDQSSQKPSVDQPLRAPVLRGMSSRCQPELANRDELGYQFEHTYQATVAEFGSINRNFIEAILDDFGFTGPARRALPVRSITPSETLRIACGSMLRGILPPSLLENSAEPVIFVHGFRNSRKVGAVDYWGTLPGLIHSYQEPGTGRRFTPFLFQWNTDASFRVVADDLTLAIEYLARRTGKKVHIVSHSFGGLLSRTAIQQEARNAVDHTDLVASLTTVGTPHSGVFGAISGGSEFPSGFDGVNGFFAKNCQSISCHQAGKAIFTTSAWADVESEPGEIIKALDAGADAYPAIPTMVLMGTIAETPFGIGERCIRAGPFFARVCRTDVTIVLPESGDNLISLEGQRWRPDDRVTRSLRSGTVQERYLQHRFDRSLTLDKGNDVFFRLRAAGRYVFEGDGNDASHFAGTHHTGDRKLRGDFLSTHQVQIEKQICDFDVPAECIHPTWLNLVDFLASIPSQQVVGNPFSSRTAEVTLNWGNRAPTQYLLEVIQWKGENDKPVRREIFESSVRSPQISFPTLAEPYEYEVLVILPDESNGRMPPTRRRFSQADLDLEVNDLGSIYLGTRIVRPSVGGVLLSDDIQRDVTVSARNARSGGNIETFNVTYQDNSGEEVSLDVRGGQSVVSLAPARYRLTYSASGYQNETVTCLVEQSDKFCDVDLVPQGDGGSLVSNRFQILSLNRSGDASDGSASDIATSDSRYVVYESEATALVTRDQNSRSDIFLVDLQNKGIERLSFGLNGEPDGNSGAPKISGSGSVVAYESRAKNLVSGDTNGVQDVFLQSPGGNALRVSVGPNGEEGFEFSTLEDLSANGEIVVFTSASPEFGGDNPDGRRFVYVYDASDQSVEPVAYGTEAVVSSNGAYVAFHTDRALVSDDTDTMSDVYLYRVGTRELKLLGASRDASDGEVFIEAINADASHVVIASDSAALAGRDTRNTKQLYLFDIENGSRVHISSSASGRPGNGDSSRANITASAERVVFQSDASNLLDSDSDSDADIYLWDSVRGLELVSKASDETSADGSSLRPDITPDGDKIVFTSSATDLTTRDDNGQSQAWLVGVD